MSTTTDQTTVDAAMEVWGGMLTRYFSATGMVILHYDCLLTLKNEVCPVVSPLRASASLFGLQMRLVWPGPLSFPKVLYYINRYLAVVAMVFCNYRQ